MNRLMEIAVDLGAAYGERAGAQVHKSHIEQDLAGRILFLTPAEGWPGKNAEQREQARDLAVSQDQSCTEMRDALRDLENDLADITADIEALEAERRAAEWTIRGGLVDALSGRRENHGPVEEAAFDDAADQVGLGVLDENGRKLLEQADYEHENAVGAAQHDLDDMDADYDEYKKDLTHIGPEDVERYMSAVDTAFEELPF